MVKAPHFCFSCYYMKLLDFKTRRTEMLSSNTLYIGFLPVFPVEWLRHNESRTRQKAWPMKINTLWRNLVWAFSSKFKHLKETIRSSFKAIFCTSCSCHVVFGVACGGLDRPIPRRVPTVCAVADRLHPGKQWALLHDRFRLNRTEFSFCKTQSLVNKSYIYTWFSTISKQSQDVTFAAGRARLRAVGKRCIHSHQTLTLFLEEWSPVPIKTIRLKTVVTKTTTDHGSIIQLP